MRPFRPRSRLRRSTRFGTSDGTESVEQPPGTLRRFRCAAPARFRRCVKRQGENMNNRDLHYKYAISYLLTAIVLLISLAFYDVENLVDKLSFALTLSSLLLAILAIFYTIVSANKQDSQFSKLLETNSELKSAANEIKSASFGINNLIESVPTHFEKIGNKIDFLSKKYDSPSAEKTNQNGNNINELEITEFTIDRPLLRKIICHLHFSAMAILYLFVQSSLKNESIETSTINNLNISSVDYAIGILNGFESTGLIDFKFHNEAIIPTKCSTILSKELLSIIKEVTQVISKENSQNLLESINNIDNIFD